MTGRLLCRNPGGPGPPFWDAEARRRRLLKVPTYVPRHLEEPVLRSLSQVSPVVVIVGAQGVGKSTLARTLGKEYWPAPFVSLEDPTVLQAARQDAQRFLAKTGEPVVLDAVERQPELLLAIVRRVGLDPRPGRYLVTASSNLFAGSYVEQVLGLWTQVYRLFPLSWTELLGKEPWDLGYRLFQCRGPQGFLDSLASFLPSDRRGEIRHLVLSGGLPTPALRFDSRARRDWFRDYVASFLKDVGTLTWPASHGELAPGVEALLGQLPWHGLQPLNFSELARNLDFPLAAVRLAFEILEQGFQVRRLPGCSEICHGPADGENWEVRPRSCLGDSGLACHLAGFDSWERLEASSVLESMVKTWVHNELRSLLSLGKVPTRILHGHNPRLPYADFLLRRGEEVVGINVTWRPHVTARETDGLRRARRRAGQRWRLGVALHGGRDGWVVDESTVAVPFGAFLGREG